MRIFFGAVALATPLAFASLPAFAEATTRTGHSPSANAITLTVEDETVHAVLQSFEKTEIKAGSKDLINRETKDDKNVANEVVSAE